jgi:hypothetical protein
MSRPEGEDVKRFRQQLNDYFARQEVFHKREEERLREERRRSEERWRELGRQGHEMQMAVLQAEIMRMHYEAMVRQAMMTPPPAPVIGEVKEMTMGDRFERIGAGATIVNRSMLFNSVNRARQTAGDDVARALEKLAGIVDNSHNPDAIDNFNGLAEELERAQPSKARMRSFWSGIMGALPGVVELADVADKIGQLFK